MTMRRPATLRALGWRGRGIGARDKGTMGKGSGDGGSDPSRDLGRAEQGTAKPLARDDGGGGDGGIGGRKERAWETARKACSRRGDGCSSPC